MEGPKILAQTLSVAAPTRTKDSELWQYHSRGARHSITSCWGLMFDLLANSSLLRQHINEGKVVFGLDHEMTQSVIDRLVGAAYLKKTSDGSLVRSTR